MGARFRKAINMGPFRLTFSKTGISYSVGAKGLRITKTASGRVRTTASIPGTGISYVKEKNISNKSIPDTMVKGKIKTPVPAPSECRERPEPVISERYEGALPESVLNGEIILQEAARVVIGRGEASIEILQRELNVGYTQAARLIDTLFKLGIIGPYKIGEPRDILFSPEDNGGTP
jgi:hypothetical protein